MARPTRCRRICTEPEYNSFCPDGRSSGEKVTMTLDEYEAIRLIDLEKYTHEQCGRQMGISRTTVTEIYESARYKLADSVVNGKLLLISGGHYQICGGKDFVKIKKQRKEAKQMKVAVTYEEGMIFQHFGHTEQFKIYEVEEGKITGTQVVPTQGEGHGALAGFLRQAGIDVLICGGIGGGAKSALAEAGIQLYGGVSGEADEAVKAYLAGELKDQPEVHCDHHTHEHSCEGHSCGEHHCEGHH